MIQSGTHIQHTRAQHAHTLTHTWARGHTQHMQHNTHARTHTHTHNTCTHNRTHPHINTSRGPPIGRTARETYTRRTMSLWMCRRRQGEWDCDTCVNKSESSATSHPHQRQRCRWASGRAACVCHPCRILSLSHSRGTTRPWRPGVVQMVPCEVIPRNSPWSLAVEPCFTVINTPHFCK